MAPIGVATGGHRTGVVTAVPPTGADIGAHRIEVEAIEVIFLISCSSE